MIIDAINRPFDTHQKTTCCKLMLEALKDFSYAQTDNEAEQEKIALSWLYYCSRNPLEARGLLRRIESVNIAILSAYNHNVLYEVALQLLSCAVLQFDISLNDLMLFDKEKQ